MKTVLSMIVIPFLATIPIAIMIVLQIYLSKMKQAWPGLILPVVSAIYATFNAFLILVNGFAISMISVFLFAIILYLPTAVFFIIYMKAHKSNVPNQEISRMTIQDLDWFIHFYTIPIFDSNTIHNVSNYRISAVFYNLIWL